MSVSVIWHQNDLRVEDNPALVHAAASSDGRVVPVVCIDTEELKRLTHTRRFRIEALADLERQYQKAHELARGGRRPAELVPKIARDVDADGVFYHHRYTAPHRAVVNDVKAEVKPWGFLPTDSGATVSSTPRRFQTSSRTPLGSLGVSRLNGKTRYAACACELSQPDDE